MTKPRIAVFSGPTATIQNSEPLITSNRGREQAGLPLLTDADGAPLRHDSLRAQRLAAPVEVLIEAFSAHPLERDAADLYGPPDGYVDSAGAFSSAPGSSTDTPVYRVTLRPEDGLYLLPYMARQADGRPWDDLGAEPSAPGERTRQSFYPDASRIFEEIDRFGLGPDGKNNLLSSKARYDFFRAAPSGGYRRGLPAAERSDSGAGDISPEALGDGFFPYRPPHLAKEPPQATLAQLTNCVQSAMATGDYAGAIWLEGSPSVEETTYWLNLLIDTSAPIAGNASQRPHGALSNDGDRNIVDSVTYITSGVWADDEGRDSIGGVLIQDEQIFSARNVQKGDARPGGYVVTGGHGGIIGSIGHAGAPVLTFRPLRRHTACSEVNLSKIPAQTLGVICRDGRAIAVPAPVKDETGLLLESAIPKVTHAKWGRYLADDASGDAEAEVEILARIQQNLQHFPLAGFVGEGKSPYGRLAEASEAALRRAALCGMPSVRVGRGNADGFASHAAGALYIAGSNLTATKARLLLMACLLRFGALPPAADPLHPTDDELSAITTKLAEYQAVFDTH